MLEIDNIRDIRLATKALIGLPQHWLQDEVVDGIERVAAIARARGVSLAIHTHVNHANSVTPLVAKATRAMLDAGVRDVRNQGVLLNGVNADPHALLDLCFRLLDGAQIMPYYFYMCDMIPFSEHWRVSVADAQRLQHHIMGYLPGFATPRIVCDVPFVGKRWVHQLADYDTERGISYWTKNYRTSIEAADPEALTRTYEYYDPIHTLPAAGQDWWAEHGGLDRPRSRPPRWPRPPAVRRPCRPGRPGGSAPSSKFPDLCRSPRISGDSDKGHPETSAQGAVLVRRGQHDRGPGGDVRGGADPGEQVLEVAGRGDTDLEDVRLLAGHRPAGLDLGDLASRSG